jgi:hypothetical protein
VIKNEIVMLKSFVTGYYWQELTENRRGTEVMIKRNYKSRAIAIHIGWK